MASAPRVDQAGKLEWLQNLLNSNQTTDDSQGTAIQSPMPAPSMQTPSTTDYTPDDAIKEKLAINAPPPQPPINDGMATSLAARASPLPSESLDPSDITKAFPQTEPKLPTATAQPPSPEDASIISEINKASPTPLPKQADLNSQPAAAPQGQSDAEQMMRQAQSAQDQNLLMANLIKAGTIVGQSIGTPLAEKDTSAADELAKQSGIPVQKVKEILAVRAEEEKKKKEILEAEKTRGEITKQKADLAKELMEYKTSQEALDPNSKVSVLMRNTLNKVFNGKVDIPEEMSAGQLPDKYAALAINYMDHQDRISAQKEISKANAQAKQERDDQKKDIKEKDTFDQAATKLSIQGMGRNTRQAADAARLTQQGLNRIEGFKSQYKSLNDVPKQDVNLLVDDVARIYGGGTATAGLVKDVKYNSLLQDLKGGLQELTNNPTGAQAGKFISKYQRSLEDARDTNVNYLASQMKPQLTAYKNRLPDQYHDKLDDMVNAQLADFGHDINGKIQKSGELDPRSEAKINMLMKNNPGLDRDTAISALKTKGML